MAGTVVTMNSGQDLPIEKSGQIKLLALGGETTTISDEFVEHTLEASKKLVGLNDDRPQLATGGGYRLPHCPLLYKPIKIHKFTFQTLQEPTKIYGLHLDGPHSYHANGYAVMANYPVLTKKRVQEGMNKLSEEEKGRLRSTLLSVKIELSKVLGSWANDALDDIGLTANAIED